MLGESIPMDSTSTKEIEYLRQCTESFLAEGATQRQLRDMIAIIDPDGLGVGRPQLQSAPERKETGVEDGEEYQIGAQVEVFSKSANAWFDGSVTKVDRKSQIVAVEYENTEKRANMSKSLEFGSPDLRLSGQRLSRSSLRRSFREREPEPEPEPEPERRRRRSEPEDDEDRSADRRRRGSKADDDEEWSDRKVSMLEDEDDDLKRQSTQPVVLLPTSVDISKHEIGAF
jgi:hypothetical protein